jgi:hypothetical protein
VEDNKQLLEHWGKPNKRVLARLKLSKYIIISVISVIVLAIVFLVLFNSTDLIAKPAKDLISNSGEGDWAMFGRALAALILAAPCLKASFRNFLQPVKKCTLHLLFLTG